MAKKKEDKSKRKTPRLSNSQKQEAKNKKAQDNIQNYFQPAQAAAANMGFTAPLGRVDTGQMQSLIGTMQNGLAGLNAQENTAIREQAQKELDRQFQGSVASLQKQQARSGVRGASATAQMQNIATEAGNARNDMEQGLLVKNIDIQDNRRNQLMGGLNSLASQQQFNLGQEGNERAMALQAPTGLLGVMAAMKNQNDMVKLAKKGQRRQGGGGANTNLINATTGILNNAGINTNGI